MEKEILKIQNPHPCLQYLIKYFKHTGKTENGKHI